MKACCTRSQHSDAQSCDAALSVHNRWGRASNGDFIIRLCKRCVALLLLVFLVSAFDLRLSLVDEPHGATPILIVLDRGLHERCGLGGVRPTPTQPRWAALAGGEQQQGEADEE